jgi:hypothetical protein
VKTTDEEINKAIEAFLKEKKCPSVGETQDINKYLKSESWKKREVSFLKFVRHTCEGCRSNEGVRAFHNNYSCLYAEKNEDLLALCQACQKKRATKVKSEQLAKRKRISKNTRTNLKKSRAHRSNNNEAVTNSYGTVENSYTKQYQKIRAETARKSQKKIKVSKAKHICFSCCDASKATKKVQAHTRVIRLCTRCHSVLNPARKT